MDYNKKNKKSSISRAWNIMQHMRLINFNGTHDTIMEQIRQYYGPNILTYLAKLGAHTNGSTGSEGWGGVEEVTALHRPKI
jgi:hypothetical protein